MITSNTCIYDLDQIILSLQLSAEEFHKTSVESYPRDIYKHLDEKSLDCLKSVNFLSNIKKFKEAELGLFELNLEIDYLNGRSQQLEDFLSVCKDENPELLEVIQQLQHDLILCRVKKRQLAHQTFTIDIPDSLIEIFKNQGYLNLPEQRS